MGTLGQTEEHDAVRTTPNQSDFLSVFRNKVAPPEWRRRWVKCAGTSMPGGWRTTHLQVTR